MAPTIEKGHFSIKHVLLSASQLFQQFVWAFNNKSTVRLQYDRFPIRRTAQPSRRFAGIPSDHTTCIVVCKGFPPQASHFRHLQLPVSHRLNEVQHSYEHFTIGLQRRFPINPRYLGRPAHTVTCKTQYLRGVLLCRQRVATPTFS